MVNKPGYPLVNIQKTIENDPVEIVDLPIKSMLVFPSVFCKHLPVVKITPKLVPRYDHRYDRYSMGPPGLIRDTIANHHAPGEVTTAFW